MTMHHPYTNQADAPDLQERHERARDRGRDSGASAPSNLSGWALWLYVALLLAALLAIMAPPVYRALAPFWSSP